MNVLSAINLVLMLQKKIATKEISNVKYMMSNLLYICGALLTEFKEQLNNDKHYILDKLFVKANHSCFTPIKTYSFKIHSDCYCWCGHKQRMKTAINSYPICTPCETLKKRKVIIIKKTFMKRTKENIQRTLSNLIFIKICF